MLRNITFLEAESTPSPDHTPAAAPPAAEDVTLRLRQVTVSPAEEYLLRPGSVRPISNDLAAAILSYKGRATVENKGIVVDRKELGGRFLYFHADSLVLNDFSAREKKLFYVINRMVPEVIHLLDEQGVYIESLPLRERPAVLDSEAQAAQVAEHKTIINRAASRLQELHAADTRQALADLAANSAEMHRVIQVLPAADATPTTPARNPMAEQVSEATRHTATTIARNQAAGDPADIVSRRSRPAECPF